MGRRPGEPKLCAVCNDKANGINFGAPTCGKYYRYYRNKYLQVPPLYSPHPYLVRLFFIEKALV